MSDLIAFIRWSEYEQRPDGYPFFGVDTVSFNSSQSRLHLAEPGDRVWLVSRNPSDQQYYLVGVLTVAFKEFNELGTLEYERFGQYRVTGKSSECVDLGLKLPIEDVIRSLSFEPVRPLAPDASIGQSIQTMRLLSKDDRFLLLRLLERIRSEADPKPERQVWNPVVGIWTKCSGAYARKFLENWQSSSTVQAFLLYDAQPFLPRRAPVFVHADAKLLLLARFAGSEVVRGYKPLYSEAERSSEMRRVWERYRAPLRKPIESSEAKFQEFWERKNGIRSLMLIREISALPRPIPWSEYGTKLLEWGMPTCVGYRYLTLTQVKTLANVSETELGFRELLSFTSAC